MYSYKESCVQMSNKRSLIETLLEMNEWCGWTGDWLVGRVYGYTNDDPKVSFSRTGKRSFSGGVVANTVDQIKFVAYTQ